MSTLAGDAVGPGEHAVVQGILDYVERLTATFDAPLSTAILTCTGSEANDIALRMAEAMTGKRGIVATDAIYHGNTALVSHLSKSDEPEVGFGLGPYLRHVDAPDSHRIPDPDGGRFAAHVERAIAELEAAGVGFAALIVCPLFLNEGFPAQQPGWLRPAAEAARRAGRAAELGARALMCCWSWPARPANC